ncbi:transcriptional regulator [Bordetella genomosp. 5]|uniref:Transcriptional regulator n=1 Tax=Bordetella genomosp. 5 TaxID=1395608 RepID=A0A261T465_9BORD|nr:winged helix-turn-helix domain-containing protein [Bordetella genomosp. 5]OZI38827.1 transcriptional regulator [Bordetella genomosp. 5]OZI44141.1 transcriptional regulator [Bordetella genomosp. 5]
MNSTLDVIFLVKDDATHKQQLDNLSHLGFKVLACTELVELYDHFARQPCPLVILSAPLADIHIAAVRLRAMDRTVGIIALAPFADSESRVRTLLCGADACLNEDVSGLELAAVLQSLLRRITSTAGGQWAAEGLDQRGTEFDAAPQPERDEFMTEGPLGSSKWRLANQGWTLVSPTGRSLGLTTGEREFLSRLMAAPERKISRDALLTDDLSNTGDGGAQRSRFVDVMISRLRRKAAHNQMALPIRAVHGWGYMFAADVADDFQGWDDR